MPSIAKQLAAATDASLVDHRAATLKKARAAKAVKAKAKENPFRRRNARLPGGCYVTRQDTFLARKDLREAGLIPFAKGLPTAAQRSAKGSAPRTAIVLRDWAELGRIAREALDADKPFRGTAQPGSDQEAVRRLPVTGGRVILAPRQSRLAARRGCTSVLARIA